MQNSCALFGQSPPHPTFELISRPRPAKIHRTALTTESLKTCEAYCACIPSDRQAQQGSDVWPIENVWTIVKQRAKKENNRQRLEFRKVITKIDIWQVSDDAIYSKEAPIKRSLMLTAGKSP